MALYAGTLKRIETVRAADLPRFYKRRVRLAGWLITGKKIRTRRGEPMEFLTFEDETGITNVLLWARDWVEYPSTMTMNRQEH